MTLPEINLGWIFDVLLALCKFVSISLWMGFWFLMVVYGMTWAGAVARGEIR